MTLLVTGPGKQKIFAAFCSQFRIAQICLMLLATLLVGVRGQAQTAFSVQANLPSGVIGTPYSGLVSGSGGTSPYQFAVVDGRLPAGLSLNSATGAVTGTPTGVNTYYFHLQATDAQGATAMLRAQIVISSHGGSGISVTISPASSSLLAGGTEQFRAFVQGSSNTGVTWSTTAGTFSAGGYFTAPSVSSASVVTVTATSLADNTKRAHAYVTVSPSGPSVSVTVSPSPVALHSGNSQQFNALVQGSSNTGVTWSATSGTVSSSGMFSAPTVSSSTNVTVTATSVVDSTKKSSASVAVSPSVATLSITTASVPGAQSGSSYSYPISATGGTTPYQWNIASGSLPQGFTFNSTGQLSGTTTQTGQFSFTAQVTDAGNSTASQAFSLSVSTPPPPPPPVPAGSSFDGPAELPRVYVQTALANTPAPGATTFVPAGGNVQTALNNANCGDTITLQAGATFAGTLTFPAKGCDAQHWIIVRTSAPDASLPAEGTRMTPCYAGVASLPGRPSFNCSSTQNVLAAIVDQQTNSTGPISFASGANYYRLLGLEITRTVGTGIDYQLVSTASGTVDHVIMDRVWLHGTTQDDTKNGINFAGMTNGALIDSYASDFHCTAVTGACTDAKVIGGGNSQYPGGPYKITNNFLEASGENILFGGGSATTTPADIEIRHNHFFKPLTWLPGQPGYVGGASGHPFMVKNLLELKNAQRVLIEGNIFEYSWGGFSQPGYMLLLAPKNQAGGCPICVVTDITIRYNTFSHAGGGFQIESVPDDSGAIGKDGERYSIHDVTLDDINANFYAATPGSSNGNLFQVISEWPVSGQIQHLWINHITGFPDPSRKLIALSSDASYPQMTDFKFTNSIVGQGGYWIWSSTGSPTDCSVSDSPLTALNGCFGAYSFDHTVLVNVAGGRCGGNQCSSTGSQWPAGNFFPVAPTALGFANFNNGNGGDYTLTSGPYVGAGSDGKNLGADISAIQNATAGVY